MLPHQKVATFIIGANLLEQLTTGQFQHLTYRVITMIRGGLISMLYRKAGDISLDRADPASAMVLMSADIERITTGWQTIHELWANLLEVGIAIYLLKRQLGAACAVPIAVAIGKCILPFCDDIADAGGPFSLDGRLFGSNKPGHVSPSHVAQCH